MIESRFVFLSRRDTYGSYLAPSVRAFSLSSSFQSSPHVCLFHVPLFWLQASSRLTLSRFSSLQVREEGMYKACKNPKEIIIVLKNGLRVAAKSWGDASSPQKAMALHGWMDNAGSFDTLGPYLGGAGLYVVSIDFIGHGRSQHVPPETEPYFMNYVLQVIDVAHALGWESFNLIAHSMGAAVATLVASVAPEMVRSMVLFDALGPISSRVSSAKQLEDAIRDRRIFLNRKPKIYPSVSDAIHKLRENNPDIAEASAKNIVTRGTHQVEGGVQFCHDPRLLAKSMTVFREPDVLDYLTRIRCPVLLLWAQGTVDRYKFNTPVLSSSSAPQPSLSSSQVTSSPSSPSSSSPSPIGARAYDHPDARSDFSSNPSDSSSNDKDSSSSSNLSSRPEQVTPSLPLPRHDTTEQRPEVENPKNSFNASSDATSSSSSSSPSSSADSSASASDGTYMGLMAQLFDRRMAEIQFLTKVVLPGTHHVHSDSPLTVLPHVLPFLLPTKAKL